MDLEGTGKEGFITGCYNEYDDSQGAPVYYFPHVRGGSFEQARALRSTNGSILRVNGRADKRCSQPWAVDWDKDGDLDLLVGNSAGTFNLYTREPEGFSNQPSYLCWESPPVPWQDNAQDDPKAITVDRYSSPVVIDFDGDGALDLISGEASGSVRWARNLAEENQTPRFSGFQTLIPAPIDPEPLVRGPLNATNTPRGRVSRICVADINGDGTLDILVGDRLSYLTPNSDYSADRFDYFWNALREGRASLDQEEAALASQPPSQHISARKRMLGDKSRSLDAQARRITERHSDGHVWLFLGK